MTEFTRLTGMPQSIPNGATKDIRFVLSVEGGEPLACVATYGVAAQIASGLGTSLSFLTVDLEKVQSYELVAPHQLVRADIQKDEWSDQVFLKLTTDQGIPYIFQFHVQNAVALSERLKIEGSKATQTGQA